MKQCIKHTRKIRGYLFGQLKTTFVSSEKTFVFTSCMSSNPAFLPVPYGKSSVQAGLRRFNLLHYGAVAFILICTIPLLNSCTTVKAYEKNKLNDAEMVLGNRTIEKTELSFQSYREGSSGANAGKVGGGCGCN